MKAIGQFHAPAAIDRERTPVPFEQEAGWSPRGVPDVFVKRKPLILAGIRIPGRPARGLIPIPTARYPGWCKARKTLLKICIYLCIYLFRQICFDYAGVHRVRLSTI